MVDLRILNKKLRDQSFKPV